MFCRQESVIRDATEITVTQRPVDLHFHFVKGLYVVNSKGQQQIVVNSAT